MRNRDTYTPFSTVARIMSKKRISTSAVGSARDVRNHGKHLYIHEGTRSQLWGSLVHVYNETMYAHMDLVPQTNRTSAQNALIYSGLPDISFKVAGLAPSHQDTCGSPR